MMKKSVMQPNIQYLTDEQGSKTAALVPIEEWEKIFAFYEYYAEIGESIKRGFQDVKAIKSGKKQAKSISTFLHEL
ncbi:MAG: hypothetical protein AAF806_17725 [Bacteroidota bacterium]